MPSPSLWQKAKKKTHIIAEELIIPFSVEIASIMFDEKAASVIKTIPSSDNTVQRRIQDMASEIVDQVAEKIRKSKQFSIQLDESTDIAGEAQVLAFVRVPDSVDIMGHILFCRILRKKVTGEEIFKVIDQIFTERCILWQCCVSVSSDGAAAMKRRLSALVARAKDINPSIE
jgi:hypothetical protein